MNGLEEQRTNINKSIEKYTNDIKNHTNDIKIIEEKITEYKKHPSTGNLDKIVELNKLIGTKRAIINFYTQQIKKLQGGVESIEEEKEEEESVVKPVKVPKYKQGKFVYEKTGFRETIVKKKDEPKKPNTQCPQIFDIGKKVNNKFFIPSQFPNLTKKKSLLKGGRKHMKTKCRSRRSNRINRKEISRNKRKSRNKRNKRKSVKNLAL